MTNELNEFAENLVSDGDAQGREKIDALDLFLQNKNQTLLIVLDGVNEVTNSSVLFAEARTFLLQRLVAGRKAGRKGTTAFRMLITSRPDRLDQWLPQNLQENKLFEKTRWNDIGSIKLRVELNKLDARELETALRLSKLTDLPLQLKEILRDPLLLGFYREIRSSGSIKSPKTPLRLISAHWEIQKDYIKNEAIKICLKSNALLEYVDKLVRKIIETVSPEVAVNFKDEENAVNFLLSESMTLERVYSVTDQKVRFRYDRLAEFLIGQKLQYEPCNENSPPKLRTDNQLVESMIKMMMVVNHRESDVITGGLRDVLCWQLELQTSGNYYEFRAFDLVNALLAPDFQVYVGKSREEIQACKLAIGEIVHDFLMYAGSWYGIAVVNFLEQWFDKNSIRFWDSLLRKREGVALGIMSRTVFDLLRKDELGDFSNPKSDLNDSQIKLQKLGARGLSSDPTSDSAVLLDALYKAGKTKAAMSILRQALKQLRVFRWAPHLALFSILKAMLLLASDAMKDKDFHNCVSRLYSRFPTMMVAIAVVCIADDALAKNSMPLRASEWDRIGSHAGDFRRILRLLSIAGWQEPEPAEDATVKGILDLAGRARNGFTTQMLTNALSCRIILADDQTAERPKANELLQDMTEAVNQLSTDCKEAHTFDEEKASQVGLRAYLLSLVCYHLLVFDVAPAANTKPCPHLPVHDREQVFNLMKQLANDILLPWPFLGYFNHVPGTAETSNIVGTLGRAALELDKLGEFRELVRRQAKGARDRSLKEGCGDEEKQRCEAFPSFLWEQLGILGILARTPKDVLDVIFATAVELKVEGFPDNEQLPSKKEENHMVEAVIATLGKVRAVHIFAVEEYIISHSKSKEWAATLLMRIRSTEAVNFHRYFSWSFEHAVEKAVSEHPAIVNTLIHDTLNNFKPHGLRVVAASSATRLAIWARERRSFKSMRSHSFDLSTWQSWMVHSAASLGAMFVLTRGAISAVALHRLRASSKLTQ